ncbi:MAG: pyrroline-5-carboxylate reductase [Coriobacteriia bacterium]|nr:pyrroline-5-carboxylate reductase [Coriobacteriia bacterium]
MSEFTSSTQVLIVGGGKMGEAILSGLLASQQQPAAVLTAENFLVADPGQERRDYLQQTYGVRCVAQAQQAEAADVVILAVKPQVMMDVLAGMREQPAFAGGAAGPLFISIAAGMATNRLEAALPQDARVVRTMPNTPLMVAKGAVAVCPGSLVGPADVETVRSLFACLGLACVVDESQMDAICAISGSGPAYVAHLVEVLRDAGVEQGLNAQLAQDMALQMVYGTAALMLETGQSPEATRISVCSPGGTTLAALDAMQEAGFDQVIFKGVDAAVKRGEELGKL